MVKDFFIFFTIFSSFTYAAPLQYLNNKSTPNHTVFETVNTAFQVDKSSSGRPLDDAIDDNVPLGFCFTFNDKIYNQLSLETNGYISFSNHNPDYSNESLVSNNKGSAIFPYWDDLDPVNLGTVTYGTLGTGANKHFIASWNNIGRYKDTGRYKFQMILNQNASVRFRYDTTSDTTGASATVGIQEDTTHFNQHSFNNSGILNSSRDVLYSFYKNIISVPGVVPTCSTPIAKIALRTYTFTGSHPNNTASFQSAISTYSTIPNLHGTGYRNDMSTTNTSNNDPYHAGTDNDYMSLFEGYINFPQSGIYKFGIDGDDAVELYIDDVLITGWYGGHGRVKRAKFITDVQATQGWHKIAFHHTERGGGDNYNVYWSLPSNCAMQKVPASVLFHCPPASISKKSCVISDPINGNSNPKRIPGAVIRYAVEVANSASVSLTNIVVDDSLNTNFDYTSIKNLQIQNGGCNCLGVASASNNPAPGTGNGVHPVKLNFGTIIGGSIATPRKECGYFEVDIK